MPANKGYHERTDETQLTIFILIKLQHASRSSDHEYWEKKNIDEENNCMSVLNNYLF